jgi:peptide/nickel transport system permease protein
MTSSAQPSSKAPLRVLSSTSWATMRFIVRRAGFYMFVAVAAVTLNFVLPRLMPGDPGTALLSRFRGKLAPEALAPLRAAFGLGEDPIPEQFLHYVVDVVHGNLGTSLAYFPASVASVIGEALPWTFLLAGSALLVSFTLGTALGIWAAWFRGGVVDRIVPPVLTLLGAFPYFWVAMLLLYAFGFSFRLAPAGHAMSDGMTPSWSLGFAIDVARHAALPVCSIVATSLGGWMLSMRNVMVTVLGTDFVLLARAKGLSPARVALAYAARNALLPQVTGFGMAFGFVVGGALLTEVVFAYPGQGYVLVQAVRAQDYPLLQGVFLVLTLTVLAANFFVDVLVRTLDPRTRETQ